MRWPVFRLCLCVCATMVSSPGPRAADVQTAREILDQTGVQGGLIVHLGCGNGKLTAALRSNDSYVVQGLDSDPKNCEAARKHVQTLGLYGKVSAELWTGKRLPYADNLVNLLVAEDLGDIPMAEVIRVLVPNGVAYVKIGGKWEKTVKPWPKAIDEWTHWLHDAGNNAVAHDTRVGPPQRMQWVAEPLWSRGHEVPSSIGGVVTARGRIIYALDEGHPGVYTLPSKWTLVARDAFNGVLLWKRPIPDWGPAVSLGGFGNGFRPRRLVTDGERVYLPMGEEAVLTSLDAATGRTLKTLERVRGTTEILCADGLLIAVASPQADTDRKGKKAAGADVTLTAVRTESLESLWTVPAARLAAQTPAMGAGRVFFRAGREIIALDGRTGKDAWRTTLAEPPAQGVRRQAGSKLMVHGGTVYVLSGSNLTALSTDAGKVLWDQQGTPSSKGELFAAGGLLWQVQDSNVIGHDPATGEVRKIIDASSVFSPGHHLRCYPCKATDRYVITNNRGAEFVSLTTDALVKNDWVRGNCGHGIMPANGLVYAPPHACGCYMESLLKGFWALSADQPEVTKAAREATAADRLEKGAAYGTSAGVAAADAQSWPQYRHDPLRSGIAGTTLPARLEAAWRTGIGGRLTQPVIAGGKVLLAAIEENTVYALDEVTGKVAWKYVCGGRVDSPPAVYADLALFGSADGWVYCLRLADGELAWRFRAAPADLRAVARDRVESLWPVHGSVLVLNGVAYCSAGRSSWIDGGIELFGLEPATGKIVYKNRLESRHPRYQEGKDQAKPGFVSEVSQNTTDYKTFLAPDRSDSFSMAGGVTSDVLVSDGRNVFLRQFLFNASLERQDRMARHLFSTSSLLDDAENHRSHWVLGTGDFSRIPVAYSWIVDNPARWRESIAVPAGILMAFDGHFVWSVQRKGIAGGQYSLSMKKNLPFSEQEKQQPDFRAISKEDAVACEWMQDLPVRPRAMLKAGSHLFLAASPVEIPANDPRSAYEGRRGGTVWVISAQDGAKVAEYPLEAPAVWDGMAAAAGALYMATTGGEVVSFREIK